MTEMGVVDVSLNFMGMRQRVKNLWQLDKKFDDNLNIFVDSGCQTLNDAKEQKYDSEQLRDLGDSYYQWVSDNIDRLEYYTEFDARGMGDAYLKDRRDSLHGSMYDKVVPIWNPANGIRELDELAESFGRVGILQTNLGERDLVPYLNRLVSSKISLHGLSMTKPDLMKAVKWTSVSSTSWTSPARYGDTIIWSHKQLKRYPQSMKDQARKKERSTFISAGFDMEKIQADDSQEMLRISLWSWSRLVESINEKQSGVTTPMNSSYEGNLENDTDDVGTDVQKVQKRLPTPKVRDPSQMRVIPLLDFDRDIEKVKNRKTGEYEDVEVPKVKIRSGSMRICDTCFLASKCLMFEENTTCAYDIPIVIRTKEQMTALMDTIVEIQAQRVLFMKIAEDMEGGMADPILSSEIDRLGKLMKTKHEMEQEGFSLTVTAKQQGQVNTLDRLFGDMTNQSLTALPAPIDPKDVAEQLGIIDVEAEYIY
jgi:hypothetical protein